jgi:hypothetical protein
MNGFQALPVYMRVNLRRRDIRVTQQFLDDAQIRAVLQQMSRKRVTQ